MKSTQERRIGFLLAYKNHIFDFFQQHHGRKGYVEVYVNEDYEIHGQMTFVEADDKLLKKFRWLYDGTQAQPGDLVVYMRILWVDDKTMLDVKERMVLTTFSYHSSGLIEHRNTDGETGMMLPL